jgi:hypothetical protein
MAGRVHGSASTYVSRGLANFRLTLPVASGHVIETEYTHFCKMICLKIWADYYVLLYTHHSELMQLVGSPGSS